MERDDKTLVNQVKAGDRSAFRVLVERYKQRVYGIAFGILRNEDDAMDITQEAFIKVHRHLERFQGTSNFYTWLYRIVVNLCIDQVRKNSKGYATDYNDLLDHSQVTNDSRGTIQGVPIPDPGRAFQQKELNEQINQAVNGLSASHREVILLREVEGLSYKEISDILGISVGTVMSRLHHARQNLQRTLRRYMTRK